MRQKTAFIRHYLEELSQKNSEMALRWLYDAWSDRIMRYILMYVGHSETAEELTSDVFFAVWENRKTLCELADFDAYIYKIAKNKALNYLRVQRPEFVNIDDIALDLFANTQTTPEDECISREMIERVNNAIERLSPKAKLAFKLVREDGMKYREAAEHLDISIKTLETHLNAAMKKIAEYLSHE